MMNTRRVAASFLAALAIAWPAVATAQDDPFPETANAAIAFYEESLEAKEWMKGPVEYIILRHERETFGRLQTDEERRQFQQWFWGRRDQDSRDSEHSFRTEFYRRVAYTNQRFAGFPKGWRSDRGRVWITLGRPSSMRQMDLRGYGRCSAESGQIWRYFTANLPFSTNMGEFSIIFVESRLGQYEVCDPNMLGLGALPPDLQRVLEIMGESSVIDTVTEFEPGRNLGTSTVRIRDTAARTLELRVAAAEWGADGVAGSVLLPVEIPLRELLFEPSDTALRAQLEVDAELVAMGAAEGRVSTASWTIEVGADAADTIGGGALRTAIVLPGSPGGYSARLRVYEALSGTAWTWEGPVEVRADGATASPLVVGRATVQLDADGQMGVLAAATARLAMGEPFTALFWLRGMEADEQSARVVFYDAEGNEEVIEGARWTPSAGGLVVVEGVAPAAIEGEYVLRVEIGNGLEPLEARVRIQ